MSLPTTRGGITRARKPTDIKADDHPERRRLAAASEVVDLRDSCRHRCVLGRNVTFRLQAPDAPTTGIQLKVQQDEVGGHTASFVAIGDINLTWEAGEPDLTLTGAGRTCLVEFDFDGATLVGSVRAQSLQFA